MKSMLKSKKGSMTAVFTVVITIVAILVGILVYSKVGGSIDQTGFTTAENSTVSDVKGYALDAFGLVGIGLVVLGAGVILGYLVRFGFGK